LALLRRLLLGSWFAVGMAGVRETFTPAVLVRATEMIE
jgi:hypothetical protein